MGDTQNKIEQKRSFLISLAYIIAILALIAFISRYVLTHLLPFFIAWIIAALLRPILKNFQDSKYLSRKLVGIVLAILFYVLLAFVGTIICSKIIDASISLLSSIPRIWNDSLRQSLQTFGLRITEVFDIFDIELDLSVNEVISSLGNTITSSSTTLVGKLGNMAISIPSLLVSTIICIVSSVYILIDWEVIASFIYKQLPERTSLILSKAIGQLGKTLWQYISSYGIIILITFAEVSIGLTVIGISNSIIIAALIAIFDILPIVGCGTILLPWTIICFITGSTQHGIGLLILYFIVTIIRNIIEPKIVGNHVGLHPIVTLLSMVIGASVFGGIGVLGLPVAVAVAKQLDEDGVLDLLKE